MGFDMFMQIIKNPETCGSRRKFELMETDKKWAIGKGVAWSSSANILKCIDDIVSYTSEGCKLHFFR
jgi:hypothetical protein